MSNNARIGIAALIMFLAVGLGAFGAHALKSVLSESQQAVWETAVLYQLVHGVGLLGLAMLGMLRPSRLLGWAWLAMLVGVIFFSGSLYLIMLTGMRWLGPVTPVGGSLMMLAWLLTAWTGWRGAGRA